MKKIHFVIIAGILAVTLAIPTFIYVARAASDIPTFSIVSVTPDQKVTIQTDNFPTGKDFVARMGTRGTLGIGGTEVGTINSGSGGSFQVTFTIPDALKGLALIDLRLDSTTGGYYAYNWFANVSGGAAAPAGVVTSTYQGIPTFDIVSVIPNGNVTVQTANFPPDKNFTVRIGLYGTLGVDGIYVGSINSGAGGSFQSTFPIPSALATETRLAIRMESLSGSFYAFNWFPNGATSTASPTGTGGTGGASGSGAAIYTGIPTFTITSVSQDNSVTITTSNFPPNEDFQVTMGAYGSAGIGGTPVTTTSSGDGGSFSATYTIPANLAGSQRMAIRLASAAGGYYAYNWFWNNTTP